MRSLILRAAIPVPCKAFPVMPKRIPCSLDQGIRSCIPQKTAVMNGLIYPKWVKKMMFSLLIPTKQGN